MLIRRFCWGVDFLKLINEYIVSDKFVDLPDRSRGAECTSRVPEIDPSLAANLQAIRAANKDVTMEKQGHVYTLNYVDTPMLI